MKKRDPKIVWTKMSDQSPPLGRVVLFFVLGEVKPGICYMGPLATQEVQCLSDMQDSQLFGPVRKIRLSEVTHWRWMPTFEDPAK